MNMTTIPVLLVLCCWLVAEASGQRFQEQRLEQATTGRRPLQKQEEAPYYRDALPRSAPAVPRYYPPAPVHYVSIGEKLDGEYRFGYDSGNGPLGHSYRQEFRLPDGSTRGSYGYVDSRGHMRRVHYSAGKSGFVILKDERILDKEPPKDTLLGKDELLTTTAAPVKADQVPQRDQELLPRAPQFQEESRHVETQQSPRAQVAPVPLPSKSAQEIQAEYFRSQLLASATVARERYAEPEAAAQTATATEEEPPQQPLPKPRLARPRPHRRRKRPKKTTTTTTTTTEAPAQEAKSEEVTGAEEQPSAVAAPEAQPSATPQRTSPILRPRKLHRPPLAQLSPQGQRQTSVQGPPPLQPPPLEQGPPLAQFPIPEVRRPAQQQRVANEQQGLPQDQRPVQGHGAPHVVQRQRRPPAAAAPPPVQERQSQGARDIEVHRASQRVFGSAQRHSQVVREPEVQRALPARAEPAPEPYVPPPPLADSPHGNAAGRTFGFGQRLSGRRTSQTIVAQSDQSRDPDVQAEERPTPSPRHRSRYHTTRRTRRPTLSIESEFPDFPVTRAPHRAAAGLPSKRRRVKVSRPVQLSQVSPVDEVTTPSPTTTTTPEPPPTTTASIATPAPAPVVTLTSAPGLATSVFPSAEQSFYRTHGIPQGPYNTYGQGVTLPQRPFTQPSAFTPPVTAQETPTVTPAPRETPAPADGEPDIPPQRTLGRPNVAVAQQGPQLGQPGAFPLRPHGQVFGQPSLLPGQAPPHLNSPFPQRPVYQLPGFTPGQSPPAPQHYFPPLGAPFVPRNSTYVQDVSVPGQPRTVLPEAAAAPSLRNRTSEAFPLPVQRSFVDTSAQGGFRQQRPALANPYSSVQPAHVFGPPPGSVPPFGGFANQYAGAQFRGAPPPGLVDPQFRGHTQLPLPNQAAAASQRTPSQQQNSFVTEATPGVTQVNDLRTTPLSFSTSSTPAENQYVDDVGTTLQLPTPAPPAAASLSTLSGDRTTAAPFEYQTSRPSVLQYQPPSRPSAQFATSPAVPEYQTTPRPTPQFQQSLEPQQQTTSPAPQSQPSGPQAPPSSQSHFRLGTPQQQQHNTIGAQPQFNSIGGAQQGYDPYQQQFGGGYQIGNTLFSPVQQSSQDLGGGYQYPDSGPFQAQFGGPYQPQYTTVDDYSQYQSSAGLGDIRGSGTNQQGYRATTPPVIDRTLLSYDIGVPLRS